MTGPHLWLREETRGDERRTALVPRDARQLVEAGVTVTVEESARRAFPLEEYRAAGCRTAASGAWVQAPAGCVVLGLKELPTHPAELSHRHVFFGHCYKGQPGSDELLRRYSAGGGSHLDLEYLVGEDGRRLAAFGHWAGYAGAYLAVRQYRRQLAAPLRATTVERMATELAEGAEGGAAPRVLLIGALGRCGNGAREALAAAGAEPTCWDVAETRQLDRAELLRHDVLVNTVLTSTPLPPFLRPADLDDRRRALSLVCDVTCDADSQLNLLPVYSGVTDWREPVRRLRPEPRPLDVIAISNLPSLVPREASADFSAALTPYLLDPQLYGDPAPRTPWGRCLTRFERARAETVPGEEAFHG